MFCCSPCAAGYHFQLIDLRWGVCGNTIAAFRTGFPTAGDADPARIEALKARVAAAVKENGVIIGSRREGDTITLFLDRSPYRTQIGVRPEAAQTAP